MACTLVETTRVQLPKQDYVHQLEETPKDMASRLAKAIIPQIKPNHSIDVNNQTFKPIENAKELDFQRISFIERKALEALAICFQPPPPTPIYSGLVSAKTTQIEEVNEKQVP